MKINLSLAKRIGALLLLSPLEFLLRGTLGLSHSVTLVIFIFLLIGRHKDSTIQQRVLPLIILFSSLASNFLLPFALFLHPEYGILAILAVTLALWLYFFRLFYDYPNLSINERSIFYFLAIAGIFRVILAVSFFFLA